MVFKSGPTGLGYYYDAGPYAVAGSAAIAAAPSGGLINLLDANGDVAVAVGAANDAEGGVVSVRNEEGNEIVRAGSTEDGVGVIEVFNRNQTRKRSLNAP